MIYLVFEEMLQSGEWFHAWWMADDSMMGCVILFRGEGPTRVHRSYSGMEGKASCVEEFRSHRQAAETLAQQARQLCWSNDIDGVPIDWNA